MENNYIIDVRGLTKKFGDRVAVDHVSLQVEPGEIFGFLGPNGSGKTTTIRMLCGLLVPDGGEGHCLGFDILTESFAIKRQVGYMSQRFSLYEDLSVRENLEFIANVYQVPDYKEVVAKVMDNMGFQGRYNQLAGQLSGGWKQRLALAAALLHKPKLLLLDEPTSGVDPKARRDFWDKVHQLARQGITSLVSTHYMDEAERCNRLAYILKGKILIHGTAQEIIDHYKLTTWMVSGRKLAELAHVLEREPGIDQVITYGQTLHVSGKNASVMETTIQKYRDSYVWKKIDTQLEDIFISLVQTETD